MKNTIEKIVREQRLERMKARARPGVAPWAMVNDDRRLDLQAQAVESQAMLVKQHALALAICQRTADATEKIAERMFTAAALAGICGHIKGPTKEPCESTSASHARWAAGVGAAALEREQRK